jgi:hypothetical protein
MNPRLQCPACRASLSEGVLNLETLAPCPACSASLQVDIFPAFFRATNPGQGAETIMVEGESGCFYHPQKKAVLPCDSCGRFLCALCDCELRGEHFCPVCLETGKSKGKIKSLENQRTLYDSVALSLAIYPLLIFYFTIVTAPMALYVAIRYWKSPLGLTRRSRFRFVIAIFLSLLQIAGWAIFFVTISTRHRS